MVVANSLHHDSHVLDGMGASSGGKMPGCGSSSCCLAMSLGSGKFEHAFILLSLQAQA